MDREVQVIHLFHLDLKIQAKQVFNLRCIQRDGSRPHCSRFLLNKLRQAQCVCRQLLFKGAVSPYLLSPQKLVERFSQLLKSKNNGPGLLIKTTFRHWNCFVSFFGADDKDGHAWANWQLFHECALDMRRWIANEARSTELAVIRLISNNREWNNYFIKNPPQIKYREFFQTLFVKTTDFQLSFHFEQTRRVSAKKSVISC